ncbi:lanthionine synthetase C family protein, partial [Priestia megaterium]|uniref:lanthionine synthetase C family protein n=1 Tax=Priestia megaterium TaxID=1404 RepID=UPI00234E7502
INKNSKNYIPWDDLTLSNGYPGLILMYSQLDLVFPEKGWDYVTYDYLLALQERMKINKLDDISLFGGLTGIAYAVSQANRAENRYSAYIENLDEILRNQTKIFLDNSKKFMIQNTRLGTVPSWYDVMSGITGLGVYFLTKPNYFYNELLEILNCLIELSKPIMVKGFKVPGWYVPPEYQFNDEYRKHYPNGNFNCGLAHGIAGPLAFLSFCLEKEIIVKGQKEAITYMTEWLINKRRESNREMAWPSIISFEQETEDKKNKHEILRNGWCYGLPGVSFALYVAGKALNFRELTKESISSYKSLKNSYITNLPNTSGFCHGIAGNIHMLDNMIKNEKEELGELYGEINTLSQLLINSYSRNLPFGFVDVAEGSLHKPGLLEGSAGICLSILSLIHDNKLEWDKMFLMG